MHGNVAALKAVLMVLAQNKVNQLLITGDLVGYYFYPKEVVDLLGQFNSVFVSGNHENMLKRCRQSPELLALIESKYGSGLRIALKTLSQDQLDRIENMPMNVSLELGNFNILLCHGTPTSPETYLYPNAPKEVLVEYESLPYDIVVMGHTHYPMDIQAGTVRLVNPGSVGQPRTKEKEASWAILDTETGEVAFRSEKYDATPLIEECRQRHPEIPYLATVLCKK